MKWRNVYSVIVILALLATGTLWLSAQTSPTPQVAQHATNPSGGQPPTSAQSSPAEHTVKQGATTSPTPTVGTPVAVPTMLVVNTAATVTITVSITPTPISGGVNLLRLGATGTQPTILGVMHDDGRNGDAVAGDGIYTLQLTLNEPSTGQIIFEASVAFQGRLQRVLSPSSTLLVASQVVTPDKAVNFDVPPTPVPLVATQGQNIGSSETRYDVGMTGPTQGDSGSVFILTLRSNPAHLSLHDWFTQYIDPDGLLLQNQAYTSVTTSSGLNAFILSGDIPSASEGSLAEAYVASAAGDRVLSVALSQDNELSMWHYTPDQIHNFVLLAVDTMQF